MIFMKVALTGSSGMLGSEIAKRLKKQKYDVVEIDSATCDILDKEKLEKMLKGARTVIHAAAKIDEDSPDLEEVNVKGTQNVLEAAQAGGADQFIYISTVGVYGNTPGIKTEETEPSPQTPYEKSKYEAEKKVQEYQEVFCVTILRPAIIVGNNKFWHDIIKTVSKNFPLIGSGKNTWQAIGVEDAADAVVFCVKNEDAFGETFIVAEKEGNTLEELTNTIREGLGMQGRVKKIPLAIGMAIAYFNSVLNFNPILKPAYILRMQRERSYSTQKIENIGWKPDHTAKEKLGELVANFKKTN